MAELKDEVQAVTSKIEQSTHRLLAVVTKVSRNCSTKIGLLEERLSAMEASRLRVDTGDDAAEFEDAHATYIDSLLAGEGDTDRTHNAYVDARCRQTNVAANRRQQQQSATTAAPPPVDGNTVFGQASVGGGTIDLTVNALFAMIQRLDTQQSVLMNRAKTNGVIFYDLAFASELEFIRYYSAESNMGKGSAAFVDLISIWAFASLEQVSTSDWLQTYHKSVSTGFTNNLETQYANSMNNRYPVPFVGSAEVISTTQTIKMFESYEAWRGNGMGDGSQERLLESLRMGVNRHRTYCRDNMPAGELRDHAIRSAEFTLDFFQALVAHVDEEISMLVTFNLPPKQIMVLVSNQVVQICDELFDFRQHAINVDVTNKTAMAARFAWVTLQSLQKMDSYLKNRFKHDPAITGTFTRFLTRQMASTTTAGLNTKVTTMESAVRNLKLNTATKDTVSKLDLKVEAVIKANNLKKKEG